jgi:deoxyribodipyrimidine photo-lyase
MAGPALVWFRDDYRVADNPALSAAAASGAPLLCIHIFDESSDGMRPLGGAARWWLNGSLAALDRRLRELGSELVLFRGAAADVIERIVAETSAGAVFWSRRYTAAETAVDSAIKAQLRNRGLRTESFNGRLLNEPWEVLNRAGKPFQVYAPYLRCVLSRGGPLRPLPAPALLNAAMWPKSLRRTAMASNDLALEPQSPSWAADFETTGPAASKRRSADWRLSSSNPSTAMRHPSIGFSIR